MVNVPAAISFFCIAGLTMGIFTGTVWKRHRKSKLQAKDRSDVESCPFGNDNDNGDDFGENRKSKHHIRNWRWKRILRRVGWIRIPSDAEEDHEMRNMGRRVAMVDKAIGQAVIAEQSVARYFGSGVKSNFVLVNKLERSSDVPSFEKVGGYRYGDYGYGPDNMSPLPVRISASPTPYDHPRGIAEVEGLSIAFDLPMFSPTPSSKISMDSEYGSGFALTSHNDFRISSQDDMMAALPIPKDHPFSQHHLVEPHPNTRQLGKPGPRTSLLDEEVAFHAIERKLGGEDDILLKEEQLIEGERNLEVEERILFKRKLQEQDKGSPFQYERASLVPAPLNRWRGRNDPAIRYSASQGRSQASAPKAQQSNVAELASPHPIPSRYISTVGFTSSTTPESRYSHFKNPLRQHPVELEDIVRKPQQTNKPVVTQAAESDAAKQEWPFAPRIRRKRYTWAIELTQTSPPVEGQAAKKQDEQLHPRSLQVDGQATKTLHKKVHPYSFQTDLTSIFEALNKAPTPSSSNRTKARPASAPPRRPINKPGHLPALKIGRRTSVVAHRQRHRHVSVCDGTWMIAPLSPTPERQSVGYPASAEDIKEVGKKRGHED